MENASRELQLLIFFQPRAALLVDVARDTPLLTSPPSIGSLSSTTARQLRDNNRNYFFLYIPNIPPIFF